MFAKMWAPKLPFVKVTKYNFSLKKAFLLKRSIKPLLFAQISNLNSITTDRQVFLPS